MDIHRKYNDFLLVHARKEECVFVESDLPAMEKGKNRFQAQKIKKSMVRATDKSLVEDIGHIMSVLSLFDISQIFYGTSIRVEETRFALEAYFPGIPKTGCPFLGHEDSVQMHGSQLMVQTALGTRMPVVAEKYRGIDSFKKCFDPWLLLSELAEGIPGSCLFVTQAAILSALGYKERYTTAAVFQAYLPKQELVLVHLP